MVLGERKGKGTGAKSCTSLCSLCSVCVSRTKELVSAQGYRPLSLVTSVMSCIVSFPDFICCLQCWGVLDQLSPICAFTSSVLLFLKINWKSLFSPISSTQLLLVKLGRKTGVNVSKSSQFSPRVTLLSFGWRLGLSRITGYA